MDPPPRFRFATPTGHVTVDLCTALISLPGEIRTRILLYLSPDDLSTLARCVDELRGVEEDEYLRRIWIGETLPARIDFALFSPHHARPSPEELVRRGTLRGVAVVSGVRSGGYWGSQSAVRLSALHHRVQLDLVRRHLSRALSPPRRPTLQVLHSKHILPSPSVHTSSKISAGMYVLEKARERDQVRRALHGCIGKTLGEALAMDGLVGEVLGRGREEERFRWAVCPGIREKKRFFEQLAAR